MNDFSLFDHQEGKPSIETPVQNAVGEEPLERAQLSYTLPKTTIMMEDYTEICYDMDYDEVASPFQIKTSKRKFRPINLNLVNYNIKAGRHMTEEPTLLDVVASRRFNDSSCVTTEGSSYRDTNKKGLTVCNPTSVTTKSPKLQTVESVTLPEAPKVSRRQAKRMLNRRSFANRLDGTPIEIGELNKMCDGSKSPSGFSSREEGFQFIIGLEDTNPFKEMIYESLKEEFPLDIEAPSQPLLVHIESKAQQEKFEPEVQRVPKKTSPKKSERVFEPLPKFTCHTPETVARRAEVRQYLEDIKVDEQQYSDKTRAHTDETPAKSTYGKHYAFYDVDDNWDLVALELLANNIYVDPPKYIPSFEWVGKPQVRDVVVSKFGDGVYEGNSVYIYEKYIPIGIGPGKARVCEANVSWKQAEKVEFPSNKDRRQSAKFQSYTGKTQKPEIKAFSPCRNVWKKFTIQ